MSEHMPKFLFILGGSQKLKNTAFRKKLDGIYQELPQRIRARQTQASPLWSTYQYDVETANFHDALKVVKLTRPCYLHTMLVAGVDKREGFAAMYFVLSTIWLVVFPTQKRSCKIQACGKECSWRPRTSLFLSIVASAFQRS